MPEEMLVFCTCGSDEEAERLGHAVVEARWAACVNIVPAVQSIYRWEGAVEKATESLLIIKTVAHRFPKLKSGLERLHSYDVPEIIALEIARGSEAYLNWIRSSVSP